MNRFSLLIKYEIILLISLFFCSHKINATEVDYGSILIITSYNPDTRSTAENISTFVDEYKKRDGKLSVLVESMNVQNLSELHLWKNRMRDILSKYKEKTPSIIILLGQESWAAFLSQESSFVKNIPVICGMVSSKTVMLPDSIPFDTKEWNPENKDVIDDFHDFNIIGGFVYDYRIRKNLCLIKDLYPETKNIYFLSDNSFGGVVMQSSLRRFMNTYNGVNVYYIDGRKLSFLDVSEKIRPLGKEDCVLVGTWRIDRTENYVLKNTSSMFCDVNPTVPTFSLSSSSFGSWAVGGYMPKYRNVGRDIADLALNYLTDKTRYKKAIHFISNEYSFDSKRMSQLNIKVDSLPNNSVIINQEPTFYQKYKNVFYALLSIFISLIVIIIIAFYYILKINKLKRNLELSAVELVSAKERAEESNKLKSSFLANMSHEIRTPLNAIVGFSSVLTTENVSKHEKEEFSEIIHKNSDMLLHIINDILDFSRMESGKIKFEFVESDIVDICKTALSTVEYANRTKAIFRFESNLESFIMNTDQQRLRQVLINLLSNAAKFTREGEILLSLNVEEKNKITIFVKDTGCGVPKEKKDFIFKRFEKLNEFSQGTGLGLAICRLIVENFGGRIWLDTHYVDGAKFVLEIPIS
ncbi:HAMP domain-containing sensor histidine kinase [Phocaeicola paurosaccharolyticus]|jgi:signal transduction histidine kinase|uniref:sensor histidine kinase n=1 Tax=Phocaeicola paurosaccharolyticus TaxID=732242 RepID=UPI002FDF0BD1